jgi:hypothetical protein
VSSLDLKKLAGLVRARDDQLRVLGAAQIICIAGATGRIDAAGQLHIRIAAVSQRVKDAAEELVDANAVEINDAGNLFLVRQPVGFECELLRRCLGLDQLAGHTPRVPA